MGKLTPKISNTISYDVRRIALKLLLLMVGSMTLVWAVLDLLFFQRPLPYVLALFFNTAVSYILYFLMYKIKSMRLIAFISAAYVNFFLIPAIIINGTVNNNSTPLWICSGIMLLFFIFDVRDFVIMFIISFYTETFIYATGYIQNTQAEDISTVEYFITFLFSFLSIVIILYAIVEFQERYISRAKKSIDENEEVKRRTANAKTMFLTNMSNEIRTPMNSIIGMSELIIRENMNEAIYNEVSTIKESAYTLLDIIDDVLTYSKLDSSKMDLQQSEIVLSVFFKQIIDSIRVSVFEKKLSLKIDIAGDVPKVVMGDSSKIKQVIMRLFFVSFSMTDNGRISISIKGHYNEDRSKYIFDCSVSDTGRGLKQADLDAIYGVYSVYDSKQNSNLKGIGLKLIICRDILKLMNGDLEVLSIENVGTTFKTYFECDVVDESPMLQIEDSFNKKILVFVSDDFELNEWKSIMDGFDITPVYTNSFYTFNKAIENQKFDYIFIPESKYPSMSGLVDTYNLYDILYVVTSPDKTFGDFDKCRILRIPVTSLSIDKVLNNKWDVSMYESTDDKIDYDISAAKILVVDDNNVNLRVATSIFKRFNTNVDVATSGEEALNKMKNMDYDLVLMDMVMPGWSGEETLNNIHKSNEVHKKNVPIIALTATIGENVREEMLSKGFQEYLAKPIKIKYLTQILLQFLPPSLIKEVKHEEKKDTHKVDLLKKENIINTSMGLNSIGGNEENYCAILNSYYLEGLKRLDELPGLLESGNISLFTTYVHGIKSSSLSIGAETVSTMFKELEMAGKAGNIGEINEHFKPYMEAFKKIIEDAKEYLVSKNQFIDPLKEVVSKEGVDLEELTQDIILEFKSYIDKMDLKNGDMMIEDLYKRNFGDDNNDIIDKIKTAYEQFDFHEVKKLINGLLES